jgi:RimJ/RimL family protein N-acetyltransferase
MSPYSEFSYAIPMITIRTERLTLREAETADAPFLLNLMNQPDWLQYIGDRQIHSVQAAEAYVLKKLKASYEQLGFGLLIIERMNDGRQLGLCGLIKRPQLMFPDIGYALHSDFYGFGYAFEAAQGAMADARAMKIGKLLAITLPHNERSVRLLKQLGMSLEGPTRLEGDSELLHLYSCELDDGHASEE